MVFCKLLQFYQLFIYFSTRKQKAQSLLSQHLLRDAQTQSEINEAVHWLRKAAKQGDPLANYNLVVAHLKNHANSTGLIMDEAIQMLQHASDHGIVQAEQFLSHCPQGPRCMELERKLSGDALVW